VDLDLWGQNSTFFFQAFFYNNFDVFAQKKNILQNAKKICEVDLDL
jgi:hypothetical protein